MEAYCSQLRELQRARIAAAERVERSIDALMLSLRREEMASGGVGIGGAEHAAMPSHELDMAVFEPSTPAHRAFDFDDGRGFR